MIKVYARGIEDLTVARYMAAMNVDMVGFNVNKDNKAKVIEIMNWVEGPIVVAEIGDSDFIEEAVISMPCHYLYDITNDQFLIGNNEKGTATLPAIIELEQAEDLDRIRLNNEGDIYFYYNEINEALLEKVNGLNQGIVITTGKEDAVGIKSFDELDVILELVERYNSRE
jgi:hypothetical protein